MLPGASRALAAPPGNLSRDSRPNSAPGAAPVARRAAPPRAAPRRRRAAAAPAAAPAALAELVPPPAAEADVETPYLTPADDGAPPAAPPAAALSPVQQQVAALRARCAGARELVERPRTAGGAPLPGGLDLEKVVGCLLAVSRHPASPLCARALRRAAFRCAGAPAHARASPMPPGLDTPSLPPPPAPPPRRQDVTFLAFSSYDSEARALMHEVEALKDLLRAPAGAQPAPPGWTRAAPPPQVPFWPGMGAGCGDAGLPYPTPPRAARPTAVPAASAGSGRAGSQASGSADKGVGVRPLAPLPCSPARAEYLRLQRQHRRVADWVEGAGGPGAARPRHAVQHAADKLLTVRGGWVVKGA
jgi:hypothetical protein